MQESDWSEDRLQPQTVKPIFGANPVWTPKDEQPGAAKCARCGSPSKLSPIRPGRRLVCCACMRSGIDHILPFVEPPAKPDKPRILARLTTKEVRALLREHGPDALDWLADMGLEIERIPNQPANSVPAPHGAKTKSAPQGAKTKTKQPLS